MLHQINILGAEKLLFFSETVRHKYKHREIPCDYLYSRVEHTEIPFDYLDGMYDQINESERFSNKLHYKASRKFKKFWYERLRCFVKYSCTQENIRESSKSHDQRKWTRNTRILKFTLKRMWRGRLNSGRGNLFCLWDFWVNRSSTFSCIRYFALESRQMRCLDTND